MTWFKEGRPRGPGEAKGGWRLGETSPGRELEVGQEKAAEGSMEGKARSSAYVCESMDWIVGKCQPELGFGHQLSRGDAWNHRGCIF